MEQKSQGHFVSLIIPVYRQEKTIIRDIRSIQKTLDKIRYDYEIIAVVDGHVDSSYKKLKKHAIPKVKVVSYFRNQGKAYAVRHGMQRARGDYVMFIDSGMEIDPNGISMLLEHMEWYNADVIVGSKRHPASQVTYSNSRKILSYGYYLFVKTLFGVNIHDTQAGIKVFRNKVLVKILPKLVEKKFAGDLEMLVAARSLGFTKIYEAPIRLNYRLSKVTSAATMSSIRGIFQDTLAIYYRKNIRKQYQPDKKVAPRKTVNVHIKIASTKRRKKKKRAIRLAK